jgi:hypothetical protein
MLSAMNRRRWPGLVATALLLGALLSAQLQTPARVEALPPRPTPAVTPTATPTPIPRPARARPEPQPLSHIRLQVTPAQSVWWTVVEWQGGDGVWHEVTGWRGSVTAGRQRWAVEVRNFGEGPFRWVVYAAPGSAPLAVSTPFTLPTAPNQELLIPLTVSSQ